jgi:hypothetical protein
MDFQDSAAYKRLQSLLDMKDDGSKEMAKAKEVAQRKMGEMATSQMAKTAGVADPFERTSGKASTGGGGGGGGMPKSNRDITKNYKKGGKVSSASSRADGCCIRGKTRA